MTFSGAPLSEIKPLHIAQYRDWRVAEIRKRLHYQQRSVTATSGDVRANRKLYILQNIPQKAGKLNLYNK